MDAPVPLILAALLAAGALVARGPRTRAAAMLGALVLAPVILGFHIADSDQVQAAARPPARWRRRAPSAPWSSLAVLAVVFDRRPSWLPVAAAATLPFRVPIASGGSTANLLVPLYLVVAAGALAYAVPRLAGRERRRRRPRRPGALEWALAASLALYGMQSSLLRRLRPRAGERRLLLRPVRAAVRAAWPAWRGRRSWRASASACSSCSRWPSSGVGFVEYATRHLFLNPKVIASNQLEDYFRVNSLFFDPNIYGRFLAIVMLLLVGVAAVGAPRSATWWRGALLLAVLWGGLVLTFSQSSFAALLVGLAVLGAMRWSVRWALIALRRRARRRRGLRGPGAGGGPSRARQLEVGRQGDERALRPHQGRPEAVHATRRWSARDRARSRANTGAPSTSRPSGRRRPRTRSRSRSPPSRG